MFSTRVVAAIGGLLLNFRDVVLDVLFVILARHWHVAMRVLGARPLFGGRNRRLNVLLVVLFGNRSVAMGMGVRIEALISR